jgi:hypothetical protein
MTTTYRWRLDGRSTIVLQRSTFFASCVTPLLDLYSSTYSEIGLMRESKLNNVSDKVDGRQGSRYLILRRLEFISTSENNHGGSNYSSPAAGWWTEHDPLPKSGMWTVAKVRSGKLTVATTVGHQSVVTFLDDRDRTCGYRGLDVWATGCQSYWYGWKVEKQLHWGSYKRASWCASEPPSTCAREMQNTTP